MPFGLDPSQIVDAEVVGATSDPTYSKYVNPDVININDVVSGRVQIAPPTPSELAMIEQRARALSAYVKLPFFALVAMNGRVPAVFRLGAVLLGVLEATQLARDAGYDYAQESP